MSDTTTILIVEDDDALRERLARAFASRGLAVRMAASAADAQREAAEDINKVLADCGHNVPEAARALGLHRRTLQRKLAKYPAKR